MNTSALAKYSHIIIRQGLPVLIAVVLGLAGSAKAATIYWNGISNAAPGAAWATLADWSTDPNVITPPASVPTNTDDVMFNMTPSNSTPLTRLYLDSDRSVNSLTYNSLGGIQIFGNSSGTTPRTLNLGAGGITINPGAGATYWFNWFRTNGAGFITTNYVAYANTIASTATNYGDRKSVV